MQNSNKNGLLLNANRGLLVDYDPIWLEDMRLVNIVLLLSTLARSLPPSLPLSLCTYIYACIHTRIYVCTYVCMHAYKGSSTKVIGID